MVIDCAYCGSEMEFEVGYSGQQFCPMCQRPASLACKANDVSSGIAAPAPNSSQPGSDTKPTSLRGEGDTGPPIPEQGLTLWRCPHCLIEVELSVGAVEEEIELKCPNCDSETAFYPAENGVSPCYELPLPSVETTRQEIRPAAPYFRSADN